MDTILVRAIVAALLAVPVVAQEPPRGQPQTASQPPQPPVTFRVEVNYVEVDAIVTDQQGNFVRDLKQGDFQVLEDGKPQKVSIFSLVDIPVERAERPLFAPEAIEPDVRTNEREISGRLYVLLLDDLHTHALRSQLVKNAARRFITQHMGANDIAAIVYASGRTDAGQEFTNSKRALLASVDKFMGRKVGSATLGRIEEYYRTRDQRQPGDPINDPSDFERGYQARVTLGTLKGVAEWMSGIRGRRKTLLFVSEGIDYDIYDIFNARYASTVLDEARDAIAAATRANVSVYAIDPRGLTAMGDEIIELSGLPEDPTLGLGPQSLQSELRLSQDSLRVLADETGGFAVVNRNDFATSFDRIVQESSSYYVLGYYPSNERRDGRFRKIEVRLTRPGLRVRARKGYVAPRGRTPEPPRADATAETSAAVRDALNSPLPISGLTIRASATAVKSAAPNAAVILTMQVDGTDLTFSERDGRFFDVLELSYFAADHNGKIRGGDRSELKLELKPETYKAVTQNGIRVVSKVELPPGRYQFRIGARETGAGRVGTVHYDLEVPDFSKSELSMSGLLLTSANALATPTARIDPLAKELLPGPPSVMREFSAGDTLGVFAEVYDNAASTPHRVDITTMVRADEGRVVFKTEEARESAELKGARGGYGHVAKIPLRDLSPGLYVLRVEARSRLGQGATAFREIQFRIR